MIEQKKQVEKIREAFEQEFGRFSDLSLDNLGLADAENLLRELGEMKTKQMGKKSELANSKKTNRASRTRRTRRVWRVCSIN